MAFLEALVEIADRLPRAVVPDIDVPAAVLPLRNVAFERCIRDRVIFDFDREALFGGVERWPFGHRPTAQRALPFEAKVPVQPARGVLLNHEDQSFAVSGS